MSDKRKLAQERNWSKKMLWGMCLDRNHLKGLTPKELAAIDIMKFHLDKLKLQWDVESTELGLKPTNPKCANSNCLCLPDSYIALHVIEESGIKVFLCNNCVDLSKYNLISDEYKKGKLLGRG